MTTKTLGRCPRLPSRTWLSLAAGTLLTFTASGQEPLPLRRQLAAAQEAKDPATVVELCRRLLAGEARGDDGLLLLMAHAQIETKDFDRARQTLDLLEKAPTRPPAADVLAERGDLALAADRPQDALAAWRAALDASPPPADPSVLLGKIADQLDHQGDWPAAAEAFERFLRRRPQHAARRARFALCLLNLGRAEDADREIRAAAKLDSGDDTVKGLLPMFDRLRPDLPALKTLDAKLAAGPPPGSVAPNSGALSSLLLDRALLFLNAGAVPPALADASRALGAAPISVAALLLKGSCLWRLGREAEATRLQVARTGSAGLFTDRARFDRLRTADTGRFANDQRLQAKAHAVCASELLAADQPVLALSDAAIAEKLNQGMNLRYAEAEVILAAALLRNDRPAEALDAARRATEQDPRSADAWAMLGRLEQEARADLAAAAGSLSRALAIREEPRWLQRRELCLRALGRTAEADRDRRRLDTLQGNTPPAPKPSASKSSALRSPACSVHALSS